MVLEALRRKTEQTKPNPKITKPKKCLDTLSAYFGFNNSEQHSIRRNNNNNNSNNDQQRWQQNIK